MILDERLAKTAAARENMSFGAPQARARLPCHEARSDILTEQRRVSFSPPDITQAEIDEVVDTLTSGWITTGPKTKEFERELAAFTGADRVASVS